MEKKRVDVVIDGQIITFVSFEDEAYMQKVAHYIDKKLSDIRSSKANKPIGEYIRTLLLAANIADDYFKVVEKGQALEDIHEAYVQEMSRIQEENVVLTDRLYELQIQLNFLREQSTRESGLLQQLQEENIILTKRAQSLQEDLQYAQKELEEYISTFDGNADERKNVVNFSASSGR